MAGGDSHEWVRARLNSWAAWLHKGNGGRGYGESSLTIDEARTVPVRPFVATFEDECERTNKAVLRLPVDMRKVAMGFYVDQLPARQVAVRLKVSERQAYHMRKTLHVMVKYCLENQNVKHPPWHLLLKSVQ
ncbi:MULTISPECIES: hypothetical protein [Cupriavidus]|jgi:DNA-directed RNA polymerase specialized sigma24 family protein|uniref:hypothetical protein n=1 Tax=Cupriavidus TaxID=106589 RepID=UPI0005790918|nr:MULTISPECIES: hypothetical protein [Cupriavidus]KWR80341.1 hypothetical protein RN01_19090 [Cupriavidus sp. SHE]QWC87715.1 hypothetical protein KB891_11740 [Cupriavidus metallidurans]